MRPLVDWVASQSPWSDFQGGFGRARTLERPTLSWIAPLAP
jgi:hypothetical protein